MGVNNKHKDNPIIIVGGGSSLRGFDWTQLNGKVTIACNRAIQYFPATYMVYMDDQFYDWYEDDIKQFSGDKFSHSWNKYRNDIAFAKNLGALGLSDDFDAGLYHGGNAGYLALNLAYVMGGNPIYLLGIDMCYDGEDTHFHDGYNNEDRIGERRFEHMRKAFEYGSVLLQERGVTVFNCSKISKLSCFSYKDLINLST